MKIIVCIPTFNEELNIKKCLVNLKWVDKVFILDGKSTDKTVKIAKKFFNTKIFNTKKKLNYVSKLNYLLNLTRNKWILLLDADYVLSENLIKEIKSLKIKNFEKKNIFGFKIKIYNKIFGKVIKENIYPKKILLFKNTNCYFKKFGHSEKLYTNFKINNLNSYIMHENFNDTKKFSSWKTNQINYSTKDASRIIKTKFYKLRTQDKIRRFVPLNILLLLIYLFIFKKIWFYGYAGLFYLFQRLYYETLLSISITSKYLKKSKIFFRF